MEKIVKLCNVQAINANDNGIERWAVITMYLKFHRKETDEFIKTLGITEVDNPENYIIPSNFKYVQLYSVEILSDRYEATSTKLILPDWNKINSAINEIEKELMSEKHTVNDYWS